MESAKKLFELIKELLRMDFMGVLKSVLREAKLYEERYCI